MIVENFEPPLVIDLTKQTLNLEEPGLRVIDPRTKEHVASILPDERGFYDGHCFTELVTIIRDHEAVY